MQTALGCRQLWDADSSGMQTALGCRQLWGCRYLEVCMFSMGDSGIHVCAGCPERSCLPCDTAVSCFHAICLVSCFMRYTLYHASCDMSCIMLYAICLVLCFMRKVCSMRGLGSRTYIEGSVQEELIKSNIYWADQSTDIVYPTTCFALTDRS